MFVEDTLSLEIIQKIGDVIHFEEYQIVNNIIKYMFVQVTPQNEKNDAY